jgi:uncharacterized protein YkwD
MQIPCLALLCVAVGFVALNSCSNSPWPEPTPKPSAKALDLSNQVFIEVNRYRASQHLPDVKRHEGLDQLALAHSQFLVKQRGTSWVYGKNVNHVGSAWRASSAKKSYHMHRYGENVAAILSKPENLSGHLLLMWKTSYYHNQTMLGDWTHSGISLLIDEDGAIFATQVFTSENESM